RAAAAAVQSGRARATRSAPPRARAPRATSRRDRPARAPPAGARRRRRSATRMSSTSAPSSNAAEHVLLEGALPAAESPLAVGVLGQSRAQLLFPEVGPGLLDE